MTLKLNGTNSEAAPAYAGDDADTGLQCGTNELKLVTGGTARATVDSSGNIGVGVTPSSWGGSRNAIQFDSAGAAYICNDSTVGIVSNMYFDGSNNKYINAGTASSVYFGQSNVLFQFASSGSANGNATFSTAATIDVDGVKFQGDTATANALDDYEEGTWTPSTSNFTHTANTSSYTKIGRKVHIFGSISRNQTTAPTTATLEITGLPFNRSTNQTSIDGTFWLDNGGPSSNDNVGGATYIYTTTNIIFAAATSPGQQATHRYVRGIDLNNTRNINFTCTYYTD